jgi:hypothetical protein
MPELFIFCGFMQITATCYLLHYLVNTSVLPLLSLASKA